MMKYNLSDLCMGTGFKDMLTFPENSITEEEVANLDAMLCGMMTEAGMAEMREKLMEDPLVQEIMLPVTISGSLCTIVSYFLVYIKVFMPY